MKSQIEGEIRAIARDAIARVEALFEMSPAEALSALSVLEDEIGAAVLAAEDDVDDDEDDDDDDDDYEGC